MIITAAVIIVYGVNLCVINLIKRRIMMVMIIKLFKIPLLLNISLESKVYFTQNKKKAVKNIISLAGFFFTNEIFFCFYENNLVGLFVGKISKKK